jgi:hypothetical protein
MTAAAKTNATVCGEKTRLHMLWLPNALHEPNTSLLNGGGPQVWQGRVWPQTKHSLKQMIAQSNREQQEYLKTLGGGPTKQWIVPGLNSYQA